MPIHPSYKVTHRRIGVSAYLLRILVDPSVPSNGIKGPSRHFVNIKKLDYLACVFCFPGLDRCYDPVLLGIMVVTGDYFIVHEQLKNKLCKNDKLEQRGFKEGQESY